MRIRLVNMRLCASVANFAMGLAPETLNVLQLGAAFVFVFLAFNSNGFIVQSVIDNASKDGSIDSNAGYYSLCIIYLVFTFANFVAAPIVDIVSPKWAMVGAACCYAAFLAGFLFLNAPYLYASSALVGFGAAVIWTGQGTYLAKNCDERTSGRNSSMLWAILQTGLLLGGTFMLVVFLVQGTETSFTKTTLTILYSVFTGLTCLGVLVLAALRAPPAHLAAASNAESQKLGQAELIMSTLRLLPTSRMLMLAIPFAYTGLSLAFWSATYPTAIGSTTQLGHQTKLYTAISVIISGLGQCIAGFLFGLLSSRTARFGRDSIAFLGTAVHLIAYVIAFINFPSWAHIGTTDEAGYIHPSLPLALIGSFLLAFGDSCWNTQVYAHLVANFPKQPSQAFALYKFYQSLLSAAAFFFVSHVKLPIILLINVILAIAGALFFFLAERTARRDAVAARSAGKSKNDTDQHEFSTRQAAYEQAVEVSDNI